ncbi:MAG: YceI family protein [Planctomycetota bacterium]
MGRTCRQLLNVAAVAVFCMAVAPVGAQTADVGPGEIETSASRVFVFVDGTGLGHDHGMEARFTEGRLELGAVADAGRLVIDMTSFEADTPAARSAVGLDGESAKWMRKAVTKEMRGKKILDSEAFPKAVFAIASARRVGNVFKTEEPMYELVGTLQLKDKVRAVTVRVAVAEDRGWLRLKGEFPLTQSDYGIKPLSKGFGTMGVADTLVVHGDVWLAPTAGSIASLREAR